MGERATMGSNRRKVLIEKHICRLFWDFLGQFGDIQDLKTLFTQAKYQNGWRFKQNACLGRPVGNIAKYYYTAALQGSCAKPSKHH